MYSIGKITVTSVIPEKLKGLRDMAYNLWWSWNPDAIDLYREIDLALWERVGKNPIRFLQEVSQNLLYKKADEPEFMDRYYKVISNFNSYMGGDGTWFKTTYPDRKNDMVAYFSAEFGLNEVLPIYSGGLGVLSGDHCKSASDLGIPFAAIGIFYKQGYFSQHINHDGWQETEYTEMNISQLPITSALDESGQQAVISVELPGRIVHAKVWRVAIGRINLYLLDTDIEQNTSDDRWLTARLYGGDKETRIQQEIFLGIGGIKVLDKLGIKASVYHMNEGHSAFLGLELMRKLVQEKGLPFSTAKEVAASQLVFTTHTPVPAGNDVFPIEMIDRYFSNFWDRLGISRHEFLDLGLKVSDNQNFNMTVLAITLAGKANGVSKLHGAVTRNIFSNLWPDIPEDEVPIGSITNGIHTMTWLSPRYKELYDKYLGAGWDKVLYKKEIWNNIDRIPDAQLWEVHKALKVKMIDFIRQKLKEQRLQNGESQESVRETENLLDPDALTLGFARRFATYKRANLIFRDIERIKKIMNMPDMPVQIIFAGKAHPADRPAHEVIKNINDIAAQEGFKGRVILLENYNMTVARNLVQGVDIWLNNPRRPLEASGTSGQKVCINGIINFSVLDGWWCEGYNGKNGWTIGSDAFYENEYYQDNADSTSIYDTLEKQIVPLYYHRDSAGVPVNWIKVMKESIKSLAFQFSTHRMVQDYTNAMYIPSMKRMETIIDSNYGFARQIAEWTANIGKSWTQVKIISEKAMERLKDLSSFSGEAMNLNTQVWLGDINPSDVKVELYYGAIGKDGKLENPDTKEMQLSGRDNDGSYHYSTELRLFDGGEYGYTFRIIPYRPELINKFCLGLIRWTVQ